MRRRFKADPKWITVRHPARCAEPNCQTQVNTGERGFYYPGDKSLYGSRCGHSENGIPNFAKPWLLVPVPPTTTEPLPSHPKQESRLAVRRTYAILRIERFPRK